MTGEAALELVHEPQDPPDDLLSVVRRWVDGSNAVDPWGLDADAVALGTRLAALRWNITVTGIEHLPRDGAAMLICNRRLGWSEPAVLVTALAREAGRHVRPVGCPDIDPLGGLLRRFGALPARPDDVGIPFVGTPAPGATAPSYTPPSDPTPTPAGETTPAPAGSESGGKTGRVLKILAIVGGVGLVLVVVGMLVAVSRSAGASRPVKRPRSR